MRANLPVRHNLYDTRPVSLHVARDELARPPSLRERATTSELLLDRILHTTDWGTSWTAQSMKRAFHEQELMALAYHKKDMIPARGPQTKFSYIFC